jgi:hypothetical protein
MAITEKGEPCRQAPLWGEEYCFWHHPEHTEEAAEARRLGGLRRRKEKITGGAYDFEGLESVTQIRRLLEIAVVDTLGLESSIARSRTLAYLAQMALKALEVGELEARLEALEQVTRPRMRTVRGRR